MGRVRFFWLLLLIWGCLLQTSAAKNGKKHPSAMLVGAVYCDTCFLQGFSKSSHFISGASVAVECEDTGFRKEVKTDEHGEFSVQLPFEVRKHIRSIKKCSVRLLSSSEPYCSVASSATSSSLHLKSSKEGIHIFSAGFFTFKPLKEPELCSEKPSPQTFSKFSSDQKTFLPYPNPKLPPVTLNPIVPPIPSIPKLPQLPNVPPLLNLSPILKPPSETNPQTSVKATEEEVDQPNTFPNPFLQPPSLLPPNPFQPPSIFPPNPFQPPSIFPPNPFQPPPSVFPPNPFQPPPSVFPPNPPNPFVPSPPPFFSIPPLPFLAPPPPPPPPVFPIPFPPFPFPPLHPVFPGIPPASNGTENIP